MRRAPWLLVGWLTLTLSACQGAAPGTAAGRASSQVSAPPSAPAQLDTLLVEPAAGMAPIYQAIRGARSTIDLVMYELEDGQAETLLVQAESRGVAVRVVLDQAYAKRENQAAYSYLSSHGVAVHWSSTRVDITHEKTLVVDRRTAYIMTGNLTPEYYSSTRDFTVVDTAPGDVAAIDRTTQADFDDAPVIPSPAADLVWSPGSTTALLDVIQAARRRLLVENEEMSDTDIVAALAAAARRGVDVEVCMTYSSEWASEFSELSQAGVKIRTYAANAALYIHAKVVLADPGTGSATVLVGSENFSYTSLVENRELGITLHGEALIAQIGQVLEQDFAGATASR